LEHNIYSYVEDRRQIHLPTQNNLLHKS